MTTTTLNHPPGYEYSTLGPWFVSHVNDEGRARAWTLHTFEAAIGRFWMFEGDNPPVRRTMTDARGIAILGISHESGTPEMVGTRQTMDASLSLVTKVMPDQAITVLAMIETVRLMNGSVT